MGLRGEDTGLGGGEDTGLGTGLGVVKYMGVRSQVLENTSTALAYWLGTLHNPRVSFVLWHGRH